MISFEIAYEARPPLSDHEFYVTAGGRGVFQAQQVIIAEKFICNCCCHYKHTGTSELTCILQPDKSVLMLGCDMFPCAEACPQERHANEFYSPVSGLPGALCE